MPRRRQVALNESTRAAIKNTARQLMAEKGTAGLSLRGIARGLGMSAPALYHYFASLDDVITALIVDAFTSHAAYVRQARETAAEDGQPYAEQIFAAIRAYRDWALQNPIDFQLIYGNPIPGYKALAEATAPAARSMGQVFMEALLPAMAAGEIHIATEAANVPPGIRSHYRSEFGMADDIIPLFHLMNQFWTQMHGMVMLEIFNHTAPLVGDTTAFYEQTLRDQLHTLNIRIG